MQRRTRFRVSILVALLGLLILLFSLRIYKLQAAQTEESIQEANSMVYRTNVEAARGQILDRNGMVLVTNRASYNLMIINFVLFNGPHPNDSLLELLHTCDDLGIEVRHHLPVTQSRPYTFTTDELTDEWHNYFRQFLKLRDMDSDIAAGTFMKKLTQIYGLDDKDLSEEDRYRMIAIRYELDLRSIQGMPLDNYILARDVASADLAAIIELDIPGVIVDISTVREYKTPYGAQMLGYTGKMTKEMYDDRYKAMGYNMNANVGYTGVEYAFEEYLHGQDGLMETRISSTGEILDQRYIITPVPGNNVELTVDWNVQRAAEEALEDHILNLRTTAGAQCAETGEKRIGEDAKGGAAVVMDPKTGEVLAMASYPSYDPNRFDELYPELARDDEFYPLVNRALQAQYPPGSVYKMCTAITSMEYEGASRWEKITDQGQFTKFADQGYVPACHIFRSKGYTHGTINMMEALKVSCNYYFYEMGLRVQTKDLDHVAATLGLGEPTGIELPEYIGRRANKETKAKAYAGTTLSPWVEGDKLQAAIGQSLNEFTPMQLAVYCSALANNGVRNQATLLRRVVSWDFKDLVKEQQPHVMDTLPMSDETIAMYKEGMEMCAGYNGTADPFYKEHYPIPVAAKTGTAQHGSGMESDNGSLVCFAPVDDPQVAMAFYVEQGSSGGKISYAAMKVMDAFFSQTGKYETVYDENEVR